MKRYKTTERLTEGDIVEYGVDDIPYMAVRLDETKPCMEQCDMAGVKWHKHCTGFCFRWENGDNFVFKSIEVDPKNVTITQTFRTKIEKELTKS